MATMTLNLSEREDTVLTELAEQKDMSKSAVMRQALRLYQLIERRQSEGVTIRIGDTPLIVSGLGLE